MIKSKIKVSKEIMDFIRQYNVIHFNEGPEYYHIPHYFRTTDEYLVLDVVDMWDVAGEKNKLELKIKYGDTDHYEKRDESDKNV
jgi:hypothetical protein